MGLLSLNSSQHYWFLCLSWRWLYILELKETTYISRSSSKAEYWSMASAIFELTWITCLLHDLGIPLLKPPQLFWDNLSALHMTINPKFPSCSKHISLDDHFVWEKVAANQLITRYIPSISQQADIFTKPLDKSSFQGFRSNLHHAIISLLPMPDWGECLTNS